MQRKKLLVNIVFAVVILAAAGLLFLLRDAGKDTTLPLKAQLVYGDENTVMDLPLDVNKVYDVDTGYLTVHVEVKDGAARFVDSPCPDHICEGFGWLTMEDQTATCLPARAVLAIVPTD